MTMINIIHRRSFEAIVSDEVPTPVRPKGNPGFVPALCYSGDQSVWPSDLPHLPVYSLLEQRIFDDASELNQDLRKYRDARMRSMRPDILQYANEEEINRLQSWVRFWFFLVKV
jgi:hypothetical protein